MLVSNWTIFVDAKTREKAEKVLTRAAGNLGRGLVAVGIESYEKTGGYKITFRVELESNSWNDAVVETLVLGQQVGSRWQLWGHVLEEWGAVASESSISGIQTIMLEIQRPPENADRG